MDGMDEDYFETVIEGIPTNLAARTVKLWQNLALYRAGVFVSCHQKMDSNMINSKMLEVYQGHVQSIMNDPALSKLMPSHMTPDNLLESTFVNYSGKSPGSKTGVGTKFTGDKAWRRFKDIKRDVLNFLTPIWRSKVQKYDTLPSGKQLRDVLKEVALEYIKRKKDEGENEESDDKDEDDEQAADEDGHRIPPGKYPLSWLVFVKHGAPAGKHQDQIWATEQDIEDVANGKRKAHNTKESKNAIKV
jgi:hypothetical protein